MLTQYENILVQGWEETYKKAQLTLWILLALRESPQHMASLKDSIVTYTDGTITADDKSMYRALRRFAEAELIEFRFEKSEAGPDKKIYSLTSTGYNVLQAFMKRNVINVYFAPKNKHLFSE